MKRTAIILAVAIVALFAARSAMADSYVIFHDLDGDGVDNVDDNCATIHNPGQEDSDGDGHGTACDFCPDDPLHWPDNIGDIDECVSPDDQDGDGWDDVDDNCPEDANSSQADYDSDGFGNICDDCAYEFVAVGQEVDEFGCLIEDADADDGEDADDLDGDGVADDEDECIDIEGVASCYGCPESYCEIYDFTGDVDMLSDADSESSQDSSGGCSLTPASSANKVTLLILGLGFLPLAIRRLWGSQRKSGE